MASMMRAESEEFFPETFRYCWMGWMEWSRITCFQELISRAVQSP